MSEGPSEELAMRQALARIDAAMARIERAATRAPSHDSGLDARHARLKAAVARSLDELDAVIAAQTP